jgi:hypothetical protein
MINKKIVSSLFFKKNTVTLSSNYKDPLQDHVHNRIPGRLCSPGMGNFYFPIYKLTGSLYLNILSYLRRWVFDRGKA